LNEISRRCGGKVVAQGRIDNGPPVGVIDIGSNSHRRQANPRPWQDHRNKHAPAERTP
jgi:hypothetical protein